MNREIKTDLYSLLDIISRASHDKNLFFEELFSLTGDIQDLEIDGWVDQFYPNKDGYTIEDRAGWKEQMKELIETWK